MQLVLRLPWLIPLSKWPLSGHRTSESYFNPLPLHLTQKPTTVGSPVQCHRPLPEPTGSACRHGKVSQQPGQPVCSSPPALPGLPLQSTGQQTLLQRVETYWRNPGLHASQHWGQERNPSCMGHSLGVSWTHLHVYQIELLVYLWLHPLLSPIVVFRKSDLNSISVNLSTSFIKLVTSIACKTSECEQLGKITKISFPFLSILSWPSNGSSCHGAGPEAGFGGPVTTQRPLTQGNK